MSRYTGTRSNGASPYIGQQQMNRNFPYSDKADTLTLNPQFSPMKTGNIQQGVNVPPFQSNPYMNKQPPAGSHDDQPVKADTSSSDKSIFPIILPGFSSEDGLKHQVHLIKTLDDLRTLKMIDNMGEGTRMIEIPNVLPNKPDVIIQRFNDLCDDTNLFSDLHEARESTLYSKSTIPKGKVHDIRRRFLELGGHKSFVGIFECGTYMDQMYCLIVKSHYHISSREFKAATNVLYDHLEQQLFSLSKGDDEIYKKEPLNDIQQILKSSSYKRAMEKSKEHRMLVAQYIFKTCEIWVPLSKRVTNTSSYITLRNQILSGVVPGSMHVKAELDSQYGNSSSQSHEFNSSSVYPNQTKPNGVYNEKREQTQTSGGGGQQSSFFSFNLLKDMFNINSASDAYTDAHIPEFRKDRESFNPSSMSKDRETDSLKYFRQIAFVSPQNQDYEQSLTVFFSNPTISGHSDFPTVFLSPYEEHLLLYNEVYEPHSLSYGAPYWGPLQDGFSIMRKTNTRSDDSDKTGIAVNGSSQTHQTSSNGSVSTGLSKTFVNYGHNGAKGVSLLAPMFGSPVGVGFSRFSGNTRVYTSVILNDTNDIDAQQRLSKVRWPSYIDKKYLTHDAFYENYQQQRESVIEAYKLGQNIVLWKTISLIHSPPHYNQMSIDDMCFFSIYEHIPVTNHQLVEMIKLYDDIRAEWVLRLEQTLRIKKSTKLANTGVNGGGKVAQKTTLTLEIKNRSLPPLPETVLGISFDQLPSIPSMIQNEPVMYNTYEPDGSNTQYIKKEIVDKRRVFIRRDDLRLLVLLSRFFMEECSRDSLPLVKLTDQVAREIRKDLLITSERIVESETEPENIDFTKRSRDKFQTMKTNPPNPTIITSVKINSDISKKDEKTEEVEKEHDHDSTLIDTTFEGKNDDKMEKETDHKETPFQSTILEPVKIENTEVTTEVTVNDESVGTTDDKKDELISPTPPLNIEDQETQLTINENDEE